VWLEDLPWTGFVTVITVQYDIGGAIISSTVQVYLLPP
jgi:hypothetical protein